MATYDILQITPNEMENAELASLESRAQQTVILSHEKWLTKETHDCFRAGSHKLYSFDNGYGASVLCMEYDHGENVGVFELAVIRWDHPEVYRLIYDTPITNDVLNGLSLDDVDIHLEAIKSLPAGVYGNSQKQLTRDRARLQP